MGCGSFTSGGRYGDGLNAAGGTAPCALLAITPLTVAPAGCGTIARPLGQPRQHFWPGFSPAQPGLPPGTGGSTRSDHAAQPSKVQHQSAQAAALPSPT